MYEKKSNGISILIAFLAIVLILGGVFLLSQSFSKSKNSSSSSSSSSVSSKSSSSKSSSSSSLSSSSSNSSSTSSNGSSSSKSSSSTSSSTSSSSSSSSSVALDRNQIIVKILEDTSPYKVSIVQSGVPNAKFLVTGKTTTLNFGTSLVKDKTYKLTGVTETDKGFSISLTKNPEEIV